jgi:hypothetical protein
MSVAGPAAPSDGCSLRSDTIVLAYLRQNGDRR